MHGRTHARTHTHARTNTHTHTHTQNKNRGKGKTDYSGTGEKVTNRAASEPFGTICHHVVRKRAGVTKRAATAHSSLRYDTHQVSEQRDLSFQFKNEHRYFIYYGSPTVRDSCSCF